MKTKEQIESRLNELQEELDKGYHGSDEIYTEIRLLKWILGRDIE